MKKTNILLTIAAAAAAACTVSCNKAEVSISEGSKTVLTAAVPEAKVTFQGLDAGSFPLKWDAKGEVIRCYCSANSAWVTSTTSTGCDVSADGKTAKFVADLPETDAAVRNLYVVSPSKSGYQILADNRTDYLDIIRLDSKATPQVPGAGSPDPNYILMVSKHENLAEYPSSIDLDFNIVEAFGRMTVTGLKADSLTNIRIAFPGKEYVTGFLDYKISTNQSLLTKALSSTNYIDIKPTNIAVDSVSFDVWFGIAPQTFAAGETVKFTFTTPDGDITKETTIPTGKSLAFSAGTVTGFKVNMTGVAQKKSKVLKFDFSVNSNSLEANYWNGRGNKNITYTADDTNTYTFHRGGGCWYDASYTCLTIYNQAGYTNGFLGLPAIEGYKLVGIAASRGTKTGAKVSIEILDSCPKTAASVALTGQIDWPAGNANPAAISLSGTKAGAMYYIHAIAATYVPIQKVTLTYESK